MPTPDLLSHSLDVSTLPASGFSVVLEGNERQLEAISRELGFASASAFTCEFKVNRWKKDGIKLNGHIRAKFVQNCVITLEPIDQHLDQRFEAMFVPEHSRISRPEELIDGELVLDFESDDAPENFNGRTLELWDIALEQMALMIDAFPRKEGVSVDEVYSEDEIEEEPSPFAVLSELKPKKDS